MGVPEYSASQNIPLNMFLSRSGGHENSTTTIPERALGIPIQIGSKTSYDDRRCVGVVDRGYAQPEVGNRTRKILPLNRSSHRSPLFNTQQATAEASASIEAANQPELNQ